LQLEVVVAAGEMLAVATVAVQVEVPVAIQAPDQEALELQGKETLAATVLRLRVPLAVAAVAVPTELVKAISVLEAVLVAQAKKALLLG
jgi:hypothetical protein